LPTDEDFIAQCEVVKKESHDPDRQVGAVIVDASGNLLAMGSNKPPEILGLSLRQSHEAIANDPTWKYFILEHAERNAINDARNKGHLLSGTTMYGTLFPCADCARAIAAAGMKRLVVPAPDPDDQRNEKWREHFFHSREIFNLAGIQVDFVNASEAVGKKRVISR
jgi:dCMP deaminase